jgi:hypothetical protein
MLNNSENLSGGGGGVLLLFVIINKEKFAIKKIFQILNRKIGK